jgi:hypothetical protein
MFGFEFAHQQAIFQFFPGTGIAFRTNIVDQEDKA